MKTIENNRAMFYISDLEKEIENLNEKNLFLITLLNKQALIISALMAKLEKKKSKKKSKK